MRAPPTSWHHTCCTPGTPALTMFCLMIAERIAADHHRNRHRLAALEVFLAMDPAVMALGHDDADGVAIVHLRAVGAGIEPFLLGIDGDRVGAGADVAAAVVLVPDR